MRTLYHDILIPEARMARLLLCEKRLTFEAEALLEKERLRPDFLQLNPAGSVPVLIDDDESVLSGIYAIGEGLDEKYVGIQLVGDSLRNRNEVRRLTDWFLRKFQNEVFHPIFQEKVTKRLAHAQPNTKRLRAGLTNIHTHMQYITFLTEKRKWLGGRDLSLADFAAGAQLSLLDYLGNIVPWSDYPDTKDWYVRLKSRPCFRTLLEDRIPGIRPSSDYDNLDF